jgi:hypothetical protein
MPAISIFLLKSIRLLYLLKSIALCVGLNLSQLLYLHIRNPAYKLYLLLTFPPFRVSDTWLDHCRNLYHFTNAKIDIGFIFERLDSVF